MSGWFILSVALSLFMLLVWSLLVIAGQADRAQESLLLPMGDASRSPLPCGDPACSVCSTSEGEAG